MRNLPVQPDLGALVVVGPAAGKDFLPAAVVAVEESPAAGRLGRHDPPGIVATGGRAPEEVGCVADCLP